VTLRHIPGKFNPSDILTKEDRDQQHFVSLREVLVPSFPDMGGVGNSATYYGPSNGGSPASVNNAPADVDNAPAADRIANGAKTTDVSARERTQFTKTNDAQKSDTK
jgi:hypothetical protein